MIFILPLGRVMELLAVEPHEEDGAGAVKQGRHHVRRLGKEERQAARLVGRTFRHLEVVVGLE